MILAEGAKEIPGYRLFLPVISEVFWSAIFILIIAVAFKHFILPKLNAVLDERRERIEGGLAQAEKVQDEAKKLRLHQEQELAAARQEATAIREKARQDGVRIVEEMKAQANAEAERIISSARTQVAAERQAAEGSLRGEVGALASNLATRIVGESLSDDARAQRVIDRFLDELEQEANAHAQVATR
ncbi:F0F1 ATP synthase subunit B [Dermabacteraceae bacterium P13115]|nr:F0F1 ATP synthase subunit B [Dermabacteraceae bacterium TAE3-ERU5]